MKNDVYEVIQVDESCWRFEENGVRSFMITGSERALLIDTGFGTGNIKELVEKMTDLPVMLVNTHSDRDHIGCNSLFEKVYMHPAEYERYGREGGSLDAVEPLWENERIELGGRSLEIILIPGHTPGSISLLDAERRVLFGGDSVQAGPIFMFGQGRNMYAYIASMAKLRSIAGRFDTVYPSHGPFPVQAEILDELISGARRVLNKEVKGEKFERPGMSAKLYTAGGAKFLCE